MQSDLVGDLAAAHFSQLHHATGGANSGERLTAMATWAASTDATDSALSSKGSLRL